MLIAIILRLMKSFRAMSIALLLSLVMFGCGSGGGGRKTPDTSNSTILYGIASKGPVNKGLVVVYALAANGTKGNTALNSPVLTDTDGSFAVNIGSYTGNILLEIRGGNYTDEATGETRVNESLRAAVTNVNDNVIAMVTAFTEIAVQKAEDYGGLNKDNIDKANAFVGSLAGGVDIIKTRPADVLSADKVAVSSEDEVSYGLALAMLSEMARDYYNVTGMMKAIADISDDYKDNMLDIRGGYLIDSLRNFLLNPNNKSGITELSQTDIDDSISLLMNNDYLEKDSIEINKVFKLLEDLYASTAPSDTDIQSWFNDYIAEDYLQDGRIKVDEYTVWTGAGGLYQGVALTAVLLGPMDVTNTPFTKGYYVRIYFSGSEGTGSVSSSMVYYPTLSRWLWYGNREWGVGFTNFLPRAEMEVEAAGDVSYGNGLEVVIWDYNLSAWNHGVRSAIINGPGLPADGIRLEHYNQGGQPASYFSLYPRGSGYSYPLPDAVIETMPDNAEYIINFYTETAVNVSLSGSTPVRIEKKTFKKRPFLTSELVSQTMFPVLGKPLSHDLSEVDFDSVSEITWTNPVDTVIDLVSLSWIDSDGIYQFEPAYPDPPVDGTDGTSSISINRTGKPGFDLTAQLYLRGEDTYGRGVSLTWHLWRQNGAPEDVSAINGIFRTLEDMYASARPSSEAFTEWFTSNTAPEYLQSGRDRITDPAVWTGPGGLYEGVQISAILLDPLTEDERGSYERGYRVRLYFSGKGGTGSIITSMVFDGTRWLWYGDQDWGLGLSGFLPWAEKVIDSDGKIKFDSGFEVLIWDAYLYAYNKGARSAIIYGPGLQDGVILSHCYDPASANEAAYFSLPEAPDAGGANKLCTGNFSHPLTDEQISQITDNQIYNINFYTEPADSVSLQNSTPVRTETSTFKKGPVLKQELEANPDIYFPALNKPDSHLLADAHIPGQLEVNWTNPAASTVSFISIGWLDGTGNQYKSITPEYDPLTVGPVTVTLDTSEYQNPAFYFAQLYLRSEDTYYRRFTLTWEFLDSSIFSPGTQ